MNAFDQDILKRWLRLIARFQQHGWISEEQADGLRDETLRVIHD